MTIYEKNLKQLKAKFPEVHEWLVQDQMVDRSLELIQTKHGAMNLRVKGIQGRSLCLYDMENPIEEERELVKGGGFNGDRVTFLVGIGLGYFFKALQEKMEKGHRIVVIEPNVTMIKMALEQTDVSELLENDILFFTLPDEENQKTSIIKYSANLRPHDVIVSCNKRLLSIRPEYLELKETVFKYLGLSLIGQATAFNNARKFVNNEITNLPKFLFSAGVKNLFNRFENFPGVIVSAGPSLAKNIHYLKEAKGRALLVATAPVVRVMLAHDIVPDLMVSIDFAEDNRIHFEGLCDRLDIPLVYPIKLTSAAVKDFQGNMLAIQDFGGLVKFLNKNWDFKGFIMGGGSVAIYALMVTIFCGCNPVIFVGQDLAFTNTSHVPGVHLVENVDPQRSPQNYVWVDGMHGEKVPTNQAFLSFKISIEQMIANFNRLFINATEGGVHIKGTEVMLLQKCLEEHCTKPYPIAKTLGESIQVGETDFSGLLQDLKIMLEKMKEASVLCRKGLRSNERIKKKLARDRIIDAGTDVDVLDNYSVSTTVQKFCQSFDPLATFLTQEVFQINRREFIYDEKDYNKNKDLGIGLKRNRLILIAAQKALNEVRGKLLSLSDIIQKIEKARKQLAAGETNGLAHFRYGKILETIGLCRMAIEEYERALSLGLDTFWVFYELGYVSFKLGRLKQAKGFFQEAAKRGEKERQETVQRALAEVDEKLDHWLKKAKKYYREGNWANALLYARKVLREDDHCAEAQRIEMDAQITRDEQIAQRGEANEKDRAEQVRKKEYKDLIAIGKEHFNQKTLKEAIDSFQKALEFADDPAEGESLLACCFSELGDIHEAEKIFQSLAGRFPQWGGFNANLGRAYIRNGKLLEAAKEYENAFSKDPRYYNFLFEAGAIHMNFKNYDRAIECFEGFYQRSPDSFEILGKIGTCYLAKGMPQKAKEKYQRALQIKPDYEPAIMGIRKIEEVEEKARLRFQEENPANVPIEI